MKSGEEKKRNRTRNETSAVRFERSAAEQSPKLTVTARDQAWNQAKRRSATEPEMKQARCVLTKDKLCAEQLDMQKVLVI